MKIAWVLLLLTTVGCSPLKPDEPLHLTVTTGGVHDGASAFVCLEALKKHLAEHSRARPVMIEAPTSQDRYEALKVESVLKSMGFESVETKTESQGWVLYPPVPSGADLAACRTTSGSSRRQTPSAFAAAEPRRWASVENKDCYFSKIGERSFENIFRGHLSTRHIPGGVFTVSGVAEQQLAGARWWHLESNTAVNQPVPSPADSTLMPNCVLQPTNLRCAQIRG